MNLLSFGVYILLFLHVECAKILGIFPAPGYSQFILGEVLMSEIAKKGHEVTVISPYRPRNEPPNYKTILTEEVINNTRSNNYFRRASGSFFSNIKATYLFGNKITEQTLKNEDVQKLLHSNEQFDLVIVEQFFNDAMKGFAGHFKAPLILLSSMGAMEWNREYMGIPALPSVSALMHTCYSNQMNFFQRIKNTAGTIFAYFYRNFVFYPRQKMYMEKYFPESMDFHKVINNASLVLLNSHVTTSENVLLPYNAIEIGGFHIIQNPLAKDVQDYLDNAEDGAIYFSLGSNLQISDLPNETITGMVKVFSKLKQRVLWKFEKDLPNKPNNILVSKWLNQRDILGHPKLKLFITHGGLLSVTESIFHGVPMVGIPVFADQMMNMERARNNEVAAIIPFLELTEETLSSAIDEILNNSKYEINAKVMSSLMKDRIIKPLDQAMYWVEYVIRNRGIRFQTASSKLYWFEVYMIDILLFISFCVLILYLSIKWLFVLMSKICNVKRRSKMKKQ